MPKKSQSARKNDSLISRLQFSLIFVVILTVIIAGLATKFFSQQSVKNNFFDSQPDIVEKSISESERGKRCTPQVKKCPDETFTWRKGESCEYFACRSQTAVLSKSEVRNDIQKVIKPYLRSTIDKNERPDWIDFRVLVTDEDIKIDNGYAFSTIYTEPVVSHPEKYTEIIGGIMLVMTLKDSSGIHSYAESQAEFWQPFFEAPDSVVSQILRQLYEEKRPR